jgi:hypothetical protein
MSRNPLILEGLRGARRELEKSAGLESLAAKGTLLGALGGAVKAFGSGAGRIAKVEKAMAAQAAEQAAGRTLAAESAEAKLLASEPVLQKMFDPATGKMKSFKEHAGDYMKILGPDAAKSIGFGAGSLGTAGLAADVMKGANKYNAIKQYAPYAAGGAGALLGIAATKQR